MRRCFRGLLFALLAGVSLTALGAESNMQLLRAPVNRLDTESLQRGARNFVNYCLTCHSAKYMRYNRLTDLGLTDEEIASNLMFASDKVGETMTVAMTAANGKAWFGNPPPDLSVEARIRGADWLDEHEKAIAGMIAVKGLSSLEALPKEHYAVLQIGPGEAGSMTRAQYDAFVTDLVNYMDYMAEPVRNTRIRLGIVVLLFLGVLFVFAYALKRDYWKDLH